jgi:hypothetical protein
MAMNYHIVLGTAGWGVWHSPDAGKSWECHRKPFPLNSRFGEVYVTEDAGESWRKIAREFGEVRPGRGYRPELQTFTHRGK